MRRSTAGRRAGRQLAAVLAVLLVAAVGGGCTASGSSSRFASSSPAHGSSAGSSNGARATASRSTPASVVTPSSARPATAFRGRWDHVVVVVEENHAAAEIVGNPQAPYLAALTRSGISLTEYTAITHPSQPNYLALFSGSPQGITDDSCPHRFTGPNLGGQLRRAGFSFTGYAEGLPQAGDPTCWDGAYARKHAPWLDFADLPTAVSQPLSSFPADPHRLPTVSFVIPDLRHDMHDGTVAEADAWLRRTLGTYAAWAPAHRSLLLVTWDEDDASAGNHIPTVAVGAGLRRGTDDQPVTHYDLLRTFEDAYGLGHLGAAASATGIRALGG